VGAGTAKLLGETADRTVRTALELGYSHVDTAEGYRNETEVGDALAGPNGENCFVTSKVLPANLHYEDVLSSLEASLDRLGRSAVDLYLIHWPNPTISLRETLHAMERAHDRGLVRNVGVSNFSRYQLMFALRVADVPIAVNQVEFHPWNPRPELLDYCRARDVVVEAAAPLAQTRVLEDPTIRALADEYDRTPAQVTLRWAIQKGVVVLPRSASEAHLRENAALFDWELDPDDVARVDAIERRETVYGMDLEDDVYGIPA
jgi:diketogulonate reductase-like aldo/keto reductase